MKVRDLMQRRVTTADAEDQLGLAMQLMLWSGVRHLPVVSHGRVVGILTERDILRARAETKSALDTLVKDVMKAPAEHIHPDADVADAAADMSTKNLGCLPVLDAGELVGILTRTDVLAQVGQYEVPTGDSESESPSLTAANLMTPDPLSVTEDEPLLDAASKMASKGVRHLCVVDANHGVLGMLSDRDLRTQIGDPIAATRSKEASRRLSALRVSHAMTEGARTAMPHTPLADLVNIFLTEHIGAVPVVDERDRLQGIVSYVDVLRALAAGVT